MSLMLVGCNFADERPKAKTPQVVCPTEPPTKGMVVATIHEFHLANAGYPFARLGDVLDAYRPDLILYDAGEEALKGAHPEDAPIDLEYVKYVASTRSTEVMPIGLDKEDTPIAPRPDRTDEEALTREGGSDSLTNLNVAFDVANGVEPGIKRLAELNARTRYLKGNPDWARHEAWLEYATDKHIAEKKAKRVLAIVDPMYRPALEAHLFAIGMGIINPVKAVAESKEKRDESQVPSVVLSTWHDHLSALQNRLHKLRPGADRSDLERRVTIYQLAIDRHGTCCVSADVLVGGGGGGGAGTTTPKPNDDTRPIDRPNTKKK